MSQFSIQNFRLRVVLTPRDLFEFSLAFHPSEKSNFDPVFFLFLRGGIAFIGVICSNASAASSFMSEGGPGLARVV